ncbi:hypothetical protein FI667_g15296, partial [Globisporangium splendens]
MVNALSSKREFTSAQDTAELIGGHFAHAWIVLRVWERVQNHQWNGVHQWDRQLDVFDEKRSFTFPEQVERLVHVFRLHIFVQSQLWRSAGNRRSLPAPVATAGSVSFSRQTVSSFSLTGLETWLRLPSRALGTSALHTLGLEQRVEEVDGRGHGWHESALKTFRIRFLSPILMTGSTTMNANWWTLMMDGVGNVQYLASMHAVNALASTQSRMLTDAAATSAFKSNMTPIVNVNTPIKQRHQNVGFWSHPSIRSWSGIASRITTAMSDGITVVLAVLAQRTHALDRASSAVVAPCVLSWSSTCHCSGMSARPEFTLGR